MFFNWHYVHAVHFACFLTTAVAYNVWNMTSIELHLPGHLFQSYLGSNPMVQLCYMYEFLLVFSRSNISFNQIILWDTRAWDISDLSRSLKIKFNRENGLSRCNCLLVFTSNKRQTLLLSKIRWLHISGNLNQRFQFHWMSNLTLRMGWLYDFPLVFNNNLWLDSALFQDISLQNLSDWILSSHSRWNVMVQLRIRLPVGAQ